MKTNSIQIDLEVDRPIVGWKNKWIDHIKNKTKRRSKKDFSQKSIDNDHIWKYHCTANGFFNVTENLKSNAVFALWHRKSCFV